MGNRSGREMSDIKYVIAGGDDGEHTRFPCLDMVRYAMAAAVTTLAIAVIVLVIHAVFRPEDVGLSINNGYISADILWERTVQAGVGNVQPGSAAVLSEKKLAKEPEDVDVTQDSHQLTADFNLGSSSSDDGLPKECFLGCDDDSGSSGVQHRPPTQQVTYALSKAKTTNLRVILVAKNPGGRTRIDCNGTTVRLVDMQDPQGEIGRLKLDNFTVPPLTTITLLQRLQITDTTYIWENYRGEVRFSVKVVVSASVTSYPLNKPSTKVQTYVCQPVTVGLMNYEAVYANQGNCWAEEAPPPSPAPAPAPPRP